MKSLPLYYCSFILLLCLGLGCQPTVPSQESTSATALFQHGVASGDPTATTILLWTKITPTDSIDLTVHWKIATDSLLQHPIQQDSVITNASRDYTVKPKINGLSPNTYYWYQFKVGAITSVVGRTKTLPKDSSAIRLITVSCNSYEGGYFNAYHYIGAKKQPIDAVIHLGDYIYEAYLEKYIKKKDRIPFPKHELISVQDYRQRYAQYRNDPHLQYAHQRHPFIHIWDDHEIANDAHADGAKAHDPETEGKYLDRKQAAKQAFYEWLPITEDSQHYRSFTFGNTATLFMLDGRLAGRTPQEAPNSTTFHSPSRRMLGSAQMQWLKQELAKAETPWKLLGNPVLFADFDFSVVTGKHPEKTIDQWTGYPYERQELIHSLDSLALQNVTFLSGDSHCSWIFDIQNTTVTPPKKVALEIGVPSISSDNWDSSFPKDTIQHWEAQLYQHSKNTHLKHVDLSHHGYVEIQLTPEQATYQWFYVNKDIPTLSQKMGNTYQAQRMSSKK